MSCPSCDHAMQLVSNTHGHGDTRVFWCQRCGTIKRSWESIGVTDDHKLGPVEILTAVHKPQTVVWAGSFKADKRYNEVMFGIFHVTDTTAPAKSPGHTVGTEPKNPS